MNMRLMRYSREDSVDMTNLFMAIFHKLGLVILTAVVSAVIAFGWTRYMVTPQYKASAMFYVNSRNISIDDALYAFSSDEIRVSRKLVDTYIVILNTRKTMDDVIACAGLSCEAEEVLRRLEVDIADSITAETVNETEIFRITVTGTDPAETERIANAVAEVLPQRIDEIIEGSMAKVVDSAVIPSRASFPNERNNAILGGMFGFVLCAGLIAMREMYDTTIRSGEELLRMGEIPLLAEIPDMLESAKWEIGAGGRNGLRKKKEI